MTAEDVSDNFDGNICRCTGYRPILDACQKVMDIEDSVNFVCQRPAEPVQSLVYEGEVQYTRPTKLADALSTLASQPDAYILSANTG